MTGKVRLTARALVLGERLDTLGLERSDVINTVPLAFRVGRDGYAVVFRYGVVVLFGLSPLEEDEVIRGLGPRLVGRFEAREEEVVAIEVASAVTNGTSRKRESVSHMSVFPVPDEPIRSTLLFTRPASLAIARSILR